MANRNATQDDNTTDCTLTPAQISQAKPRLDAAFLTVGGASALLAQWLQVHPGEAGQPSACMNDVDPLSGDAAMGMGKLLESAQADVHAVMDVYADEPGGVPRDVLDVSILLGGLRDLLKAAELASDGGADGALSGSAGAVVCTVLSGLMARISELPLTRATLPDEATEAA